MIFKEQYNLNLSIDNEMSEQVSEIRYLGIIVDSNLTFGQHIDFIVKKISKKIGYFKRIRNRLDLSSAINVYNAIIRPHFEYCSTVLFVCDQNSFVRLQRLQNKAMRCILKCNRYTSISLMLNSLRWLSIKQRIAMNVLIFIYKMKSGIMPSYLTRLINYVRDVQPYRLRNSSDFRLPLYRIQSTQNSLVYRGFQLFNMLPAETKSEVNFYCFKKKIIEFVQVKYPV